MDGQQKKEGLSLQCMTYRGEIEGPYIDLIGGIFGFRLGKITS